MKLKPIGAWALAKPVEQEEKMASAVVLPETAKEKPQVAKVVTVGGSDEVGVSEGELVVFARYSGARIDVDDEDYLIPDRADLLGVVEE